MSFASNLREILDFQDIQVKELAAKTGISKNTTDNYLSGQKSLPYIENGVKIAQALGVTVEFLVTGSPRLVQKQPAPPPDADKHKKLLDAITSLDDIDIASVSALVHGMKKRYSR